MVTASYYLEFKKIIYSYQYYHEQTKIYPYCAKPSISSVFVCYKTRHWIDVLVGDRTVVAHRQAWTRISKHNLNQRPHGSCPRHQCLRWTKRDYRACVDNRTVVSVRSMCSRRSLIHHVTQIMHKSFRGFSVRGVYATSQGPVEANVY